MPAVTTSADILTALQALLAAVAAGHVTPDEAVSVSTILEINARRLKPLKLKHVLAKLEAK